MPRKKKEETVEETQPEVTAEAAPAETAAPAEDKPKRSSKTKAAPKAKADKSETNGDGSQDKRHKRAERIGVVWSDKMTNTVVVRVDRLVKHPMYRKYVKKRKKLMAHNGIGAAEGDKVRIVETRPLSARKRWRVVEIIQKAER